MLVPLTNTAMELTSPESETGGTPAPYGQACEACSKSKCKCILIRGQQACQRCHRLGRECRTSNNKRKRAAGDKSEKVSRIDEAVGKTAQLERRLDELVAALHQSGRPSEPLPLPSAESTSLQRDQAAFATPPSTAATGNDGHSDKEAGRNLWAAARLTTDEADQRFHTFRTVCLKWAPFMHLPPIISSTQLYESKPITWFSIMLTCARDDVEIHRLDNIFREVIAEEMVVRSKKSIDILLGLLVFMSWYNHHCRNENGNVKISLSLLVSMAISLVYDLKVPKINHPQQMLNRHLYRHWPEHDAHVRPLEEVRAYLWCFLASAVISSYLRNDPLRWSSFLGECLSQLQAKPAWEGDEVLVQLIWQQVILEKANMMRRMEDAMQSADNLSAPPSHYVQVLLQQLRQVQESCPAHLRDKDIISIHFHSIEFSITELGLAPSTAQNVLQQREIRYACRASARAWFERYLVCAPAEYLATAFTSAIQSSHCLGMLFYLSTPDEPVWTKDDVRETNALDIVDRTIVQMDEAVLALGIKENDTLSTHIQLYRSLRATWAAKLADVEAGMRPEKDQGLAENGLGLEMGNAAFGEMLDLGFLESDWLFAWPPLGGI